MDANRTDRQQAVIAELATELASVVSALLASNAAAVAGAGPLTPGWTVSCGFSGSLHGRMVVGISDADATMLARRLMGMDEDPAADAVSDTLGEVVGQAVGGLSQKPVASGAKIRVEGTASHGVLPAPDTPAVFDIAMEDGSILRFGCVVQLEAEGESQLVSADTSDPLAAVPPAMAAMAAARPAGASTPAGLENLDVILDIELPLTVRFGRTEMTLQALTHIGPGSVIDLDRSPDEAVDVLINDKVIARGEVVVVSGSYGVRVTEVISAADRIRSLGQ